jgi:hypothetical protein
VHVNDNHEKKIYNGENFLKKGPRNIIWPILVPYISRNQPKCNQFIYDYMRLVVICD